MSLQVLTVEPLRDRTIKACRQLIDDEVKSKGGMSGLAIRGAFAVVKAVKPGFVEEVIDALLDEWIANLEPMVEEWKASGRGAPLEDYFGARRGDAAERLLAVTDSRAAHAKNSTVRKAYEKMRPSAKKHVEEAVPKLARIVSDLAGDQI